MIRLKSVYDNNNNNGISTAHILPLEKVVKQLLLFLLIICLIAFMNSLAEFSMTTAAHVSSRYHYYKYSMGKLIHIYTCIHSYINLCVAANVAKLKPRLENNR